MKTLKLILALVMIAAVGCGATDAKTDENKSTVSVATVPPVVTDKPVVAATPPTISTVKFPDAPWFKREGEIRKIWEYVPTDVTGTTASPRGNVEFKIARVEADSRSLFLYAQRRLRNRGNDGVKRQRRTEAATVMMTVNSCRQRAPRIAGVIEEDATEPDLLAIPLSDLPPGDVELEISAFGNKRTIPLLNYEDGLRVMTDLSQSKWYREDVSGDGSKAFTMDYPDRERCEGEISE